MFREHSSEFIYRVRVEALIVTRSCPSWGIDSSEFIYRVRVEALRVIRSCLSWDIVELLKKDCVRFNIDSKGDCAILGLTKVWETLMEYAFSTYTFKQKWFKNLEYIENMCRLKTYTCLWAE